MGNNEYRFRLKKDVECITELDIRRPSLYAQGLQVPTEPASLDFIKLKAPVVLTILEKRPVEAELVDGPAPRRAQDLPVGGGRRTQEWLDEHRQLYPAVREEQPQQARSVLPAVGFRSGLSRFEVSQRFNKKRMTVETGIRQAQPTQTTV